MLFAIDAVRYPVYGIDRYPSIEEKACALAHAVIRSHVFVDGNKRTGTAVLLQMLELNGRTLQVTEDDLVETIESLAAGDLTWEGFLAWVRARVR